MLLHKEFISSYRISAGCQIIEKADTQAIYVFFLCTQIVKEYERAIIFRLGRILRGGAKGPGQRPS